MLEIVKGVVYLSLDWKILPNQCYFCQTFGAKHEREIVVLFPVLTAGRSLKLALRFTN